MYDPKQAFKNHLAEDYLNHALGKLSAHELLALIDYTQTLTKKDLLDLIDKYTEKIKENPK